MLIIRTFRTSQSDIPPAYLVVNKLHIEKAKYEGRKHKRVKFLACDSCPNCIQISLILQFPLVLRVLLRPDTRLSRGQNTLGVYGILDNLIESQECPVIPIVCTHNLIHDS